jgi:hypothetical protein
MPKVPRFGAPRLVACRDPAAWVTILEAVAMVPDGVTCQRV